MFDMSTTDFNDGARVSGRGGVMAPCVDWVYVAITFPVSICNSFTITDLNDNQFQNLGVE